jgi:hypothetical protein
MIISGRMAHVVLFSFCSQCGGQVCSDNSFCGQCGAPVPVFNQPSGQPRSERRVPRVSAFSVFVPMFALWIYLSPYVAVWNLKEAARTGNIEALSEGVDFQALRESLKAELSSHLAGETPHKGSEEDAGFALLGNAFAGALAGVVIDQIATPQGIVNLIQGKKTVLDDVDPLTLWNGTGRISTGYESLDRFDVRIFQPDSKAPMVLVWRRSGFINWRFSEVHIPNLN